MSQKDKILWNERVGDVFYSMFKNKKTLFNIQKLKIPFYFVNNHNDKDCIDLINNFQIDCLFNAGTQRKLSSKVLKSVKKGVINIHSGILPEYRGCTCVEWANLNDEKVGNTAHYMTKEYDSGPIIMSQTYKFPYNCDYKYIRAKVAYEACKMTGKVLSFINNNKRVNAIEQNHQKAKYYKPISKHNLDLVLEKIKDKKYKYLN